MGPQVRLGHQAERGAGLPHRLHPSARAAQQRLQVPGQHDLGPHPGGVRLEDHVGERAEALVVPVGGQGGVDRAQQVAVPSAEAASARTVNRTRAVTAAASAPLPATSPRTAHQRPSGSGKSS